MSFTFLSQLLFAWTCLEIPKLIHASDTPPELEYEIVTPIIHSVNKLAGTLTLKISDYILHLKREELPPRFTHIYYKDSKRVVESDIAGCIYNGEVEGYPTWSAAVTLCKGIQGYFGSNLDMKYVQPLDLTATSYLITQPHIIYTDSQQQNYSNLGVCAPVMSPIQGGRSIQAQLILGPMYNQTYNTAHKIVEIVFVNDYHQYLRFQRSLSSVLLRNIEILEIMKELFEVMNISIAMVGVITWTEKNLIDMPNDMDSVNLLIKFMEYYHKIPGHLDCALLISGHRFKDNVVGLAYKSAMCYGSHSVGIVQDGRNRANAVGGTATHELGHLLGMSHDDFEGRTCSCDDPTGKCIMASIAPSGSEVSTMWSNCSAADMEESFNMYPSSEACLFNEPSIENISHVALTGRGDPVKSFTAITITIMIAGHSFIFFT